VLLPLTSSPAPGSQRTPLLAAGDRGHVACADIVVYISPSDRCLGVSQQRWGQLASSSCDRCAWWVVVAARTLAYPSFHLSYPCSRQVHLAVLGQIDFDPSHIVSGDMLKQVVVCFLTMSAMCVDDVHETCHWIDSHDFQVGPAACECDATDSSCVRRVTDKYRQTCRLRMREYGRGCVSGRSIRLPQVVLMSKRR
jgi:hypothetical protein